MGRTVKEIIIPVNKSNVLRAAAQKEFDDTIGGGLLVSTPSRFPY
jgi:hypothetical protein